MDKRKTSKLNRKKAVPIKLTGRDQQILLALHKYRFLTTDHLQALTGTKSRWGMNARLRLLYDHKYVDRPKAQHTIFAYADKRPLVYALGNKGASCLSTRFGLKMPAKVYWTEKNRRVREKHIEHTLGISDFMVSIEIMCADRPELEFIEPDTILANSPAQTRQARYPFRWKTQIADKGKRHDIAIVPDYVFGIKNRQTTQERFYFVEIDRGTMPVTRRDITQTSFLRKILSYADTFERSLALKRFGIKGFQVLTVTTSEARIKAIQNAIATLPERPFSAGTFLFKTKVDNQIHFSFHSDWQTSKGASADII